VNIYYKVTRVDYTWGTTYYELVIPFKVYNITVYFATSHLPHKHLAKYRPFSYFMIFPGDVLGIVVSPICNSGEDKEREPDYRVEIEKPNRETLKLLIEKVSGGISGARLGGDIRPENIVNEFLKTLLIEQ